MARYTAWDLRDAINRNEAYDNLTGHSKNREMYQQWIKKCKELVPHTVAIDLGHQPPVTVGEEILREFTENDTREPYDRYLVYMDVPNNLFTGVPGAVEEYGNGRCIMGAWVISGDIDFEYAESDISYLWRTPLIVPFACVDGQLMLSDFAGILGVLQDGDRNRMNCSMFFMDDDKENRESKEHAIFSAFGSYFILHQMLRCKNIEIREAPIKSKKSPKKHDFLKTVDIIVNLPGKGIIYQNQQMKKLELTKIQKMGNPRQVRGHFKTYTEEKPLFGKYTGTWWWSPVLGNPVRNVTVKGEK